MTSNSRPAVVKTLRGHTERALSIAFSPDRKQLASGSQDRSIIVWDLENAEKRYPVLPRQPGYVGVGSVTFSPDGKLLGGRFRRRRRLALVRRDRAARSIRLVDTKDRCMKSPFLASRTVKKCWPPAPRMGW